MNLPERLVILLSGGLDSAANLVFAKQKANPILALTFDFGQRAAHREIEAAVRFCEHYKVKHKVVRIPFLGALGGNALTDSSLSLPSVEIADLDDERKTNSTMKAVWVPNRNGVLLNVAAAFAERAGAERIVVGFNKEEARTFKDNSYDFIKRTTSAFELSTSNSVSVHSYTHNLDKTQILKSVLKLDSEFPVKWVWSCYDGGKQPCGVCESCQRFKRAVESI